MGCLCGRGIKIDLFSVNTWQYTWLSVFDNICVFRIGYNVIDYFLLECCICFLLFVLQSTYSPYA